MPARAKRPRAKTRKGTKAKGRASPKAKGTARRKAAAPATKARTARVPAGWRLDRGGKSISIEVRAKDFVDALDLFNAVGAIAEDVDHHPDLHLTRWNRVRISTWSHDVGRLTERDRRLATRVNDLLQRRSLHRHALAAEA